MAISITFQRSLAVAFAAATLTGCGAAESPMAALPAQSRQVPRLSPLVYISDSRGNFVDIFSLDGKLLGKLTIHIGYPGGLFVDAKHDLWVANEGGPDVARFRRGSVKPEIYRLSGGESPYNVTTCADGTLYVTTFSDTIAVFAHV